MKIRSGLIVALTLGLFCFSLSCEKEPLTTDRRATAEIGDSTTLNELAAQRKVSSGELSSTNDWVWNCGSKNDLDYRVYWGNNGTLTIQRPYLRSIHYTLRGWNPRDGWVTKSHSSVLPTPTSNPHTFNNVALTYAFARQQAHLYWGLGYILKGEITVKYGPDDAIAEEEVITSITGCFRGSDPHYFDYFGCQPPDVGCCLPNGPCD